MTVRAGDLRCNYFTLESPIRMRGFGDEVTTEMHFIFSSVS